MNNISIKKMRVFISVVREGSFSAASVKENISQPATSIIVNEVEDTVGVSLFLRNGAVRKAILTEAGEHVFNVFSRIVSDFDIEMTSISNTVHKKSQKCQMIVQTPFLDVLPGAWLSGLVDSMNAVDVQIDIGPRTRAIDSIQKREANFGFVDGMVDSAKSDYIELLSYKMVMVSPKHCYTGEGNYLEDWSKIPKDIIVISGLEPQIRRQLDRLLNRPESDNTRVMKVDGSILAARMQSEMQFSVIVPDILVPAIDPCGTCRVVDLPEPALRSSLGLITPWGTLSRNKVMNFLKANPVKAA